MAFLCKLLSILWVCLGNEYKLNKCFLFLKGPSVMFYWGLCKIVNALTLSPEKYSKDKICAQKIHKYSEIKQLHNLENYTVLRGIK